MNHILFVLIFCLFTCSLHSQEQTLSRPVLSISTGNQDRLGISYAHYVTKQFFPRILLTTDQVADYRLELSNIWSLKTTPEYGFYAFGSIVGWDYQDEIHRKYDVDVYAGIGSKLRLPWRFVWWTEVYASGYKPHFRLRTGAGFTF